MTEVRSRLRNRAMLRNLTTLCPIVYNNPRWSGKCYILRQFCRIYDLLRTVAESEASTVTMNLTPAFKAQVSRFAEKLAQIDSVTKYLQSENLTLVDPRLALDTLVDVVHEKTNDEDAILYKGKLSPSHVSSSSRHCLYKAFESGIVKIQRNRARTLTQSERRTFQTLLLSEECDSSQVQATSTDTWRDVLDEIRKQ